MSEANRHAGGSALRLVAVRFVGLAVLLTLVVSMGAEAVERATLPWFRLVLQAIDSDHQVVDLRLGNAASGRVVQLTVVRHRYVVVAGRALEPDTRAKASAQTLAGHARLAVVLVVSSAFAWPWRNAAQLLLRGLACVAALAFSLALDIPLLLHGEIWRLYANALDPGGWWPSILWADFLLDGGRYALPIACGLFAACVAGGFRRDR